MVIEFYSGFSKRKNSTKRPTGDPTLSLTGDLREPCSTQNPVFNIKRLPADVHPSYLNYCVIPVMARWYFVKDWIWNNGLWECHLEEDYLGTWKNQIGASTAYIERCAYDSNGTIIDKLYPAMNDFDTVNQVLTAPWTVGWDIDDGTYILGIISGTQLANVGGVVHYYALTQAQMQTLISNLMSDAFFNSIGFTSNDPNATQLTHDVAKSLINPMQYIVSCMWFPADVSNFTASTDTDVPIMIGAWITIGQGKLLTRRVGYRQTYTLTMPTHPQASTRGAFLNYSPYSQYTCFMPPFGSFAIDPSYIPDNRQIVFEMQVDGITGKACLQLCREDQTYGEVDFFYQTTALFGVPIQLAQSATDYIGAVKAGLQGMVGMGIAGNTLGVAGFEMSFLGTVGNVLGQLTPNITSEGTNGSFIAFERLIGTRARMTSKFVYIVDEDNVELGRPLCEVRTISDLPGYIKCGEVTVDYPCMSEEKERIHEMLLSGFFWE